jgi:hypothetical protein
LETSLLENEEGLNVLIDIFSGELELSTGKYQSHISRKPID